jgi:DNA-binding response OmpR family regulator
MLEKSWLVLGRRWNGNSYGGTTKNYLRQSSDRCRIDTVENVDSRLLVIEDDVRIGSTLKRALEGSGYVVSWATTGREGIDAFLAGLSEQLPFQLVLLDLGLPDVDGLDVCRSLIEADPLLPVVMLTARDEELDSVVGLDAGAIDYVTKPFNLSPLLARIRAQLRRIEHPGSGMTTSSNVVVGTLTINKTARRVHQDGNEIKLRPKEFDLLARLAADAGNAITRETLMDEVWDTEWFGSTKTLDFHIAALRAKLDSGSGPSIITTIRGVGFRLEN